MECREGVGSVAWRAGLGAWNLGVRCALGRRRVEGRGKRCPGGSPGIGGGWCLVSACPRRNGGVEVMAGRLSGPRLGTAHGGWPVCWARFLAAIGMPLLKRTQPYRRRCEVLEVLFATGEFRRQRLEGSGAPTVMAAGGRQCWALLAVDGRECWSAVF